MVSREERERRREQQRQFEDFVPDVFLAVFELYNEPPTEILSTVHYMHKCLLAPCVPKKQLEPIHGQRQPAPVLALILHKHYAKWFFDALRGAR